MSELLKQIFLEALVNTGFKERYIELKKNSKLTDEVFKVLSSHAMRKLVKNRTKVPNISAECLHALDIASKYYGKEYDEDKQDRLATEVTKYIQEDFHSHAQILLELDTHKKRMTKALAHEQKEIIEVNEGFMPIFVSAESFDDEIVFEFEDKIYWVRTKTTDIKDEPVLQECVDLILSIDPSLEGDFDKLTNGLIHSQVDTKEFEEYKKLLS
nr:MAG TPA: hypothetical protein [Bacteriophage sp.]